MQVFAHAGVHSVKRVEFDHEFVVIFRRTEF